MNFFTKYILLSLCIVILLVSCTKKEVSEEAVSTSTQIEAVKITNELTESPTEVVTKASTTTSPVKTSTPPLNLDKYKKLLPNTIGEKINYNGFAEYGHQLTLDSIKKADNNIVYTLTGEVDDVSGGESNRDYTLKIRYIIYKNGIVQYVDKGDQFMDKRYKKIELINGSLTLGNTWTQNVHDSKNNKDIKLNCKITNIQNNNGKNIYTIKYDDPSSEYYEIREIKEDTGIITVKIIYSYEYEGKSTNEEIGYTIFQN